MPNAATVITSQPSGRSIVPAYNPIEIVVSDPAAVIMYCDIYFNGIYYKTLTCTSPVSSIFRFDLQDAAQEILRSVPPTTIGNLGFNADTTVVNDCFCRLREAVMSSGLLIPEVPIPIQVTMTTPAVQGGGLMTNTFQVINSRLQHEDNQDLITHLFHYITQTVSFLNNWRVYPLSHRTHGYKVGRNSYDNFPVYFSNVGGTLFPSNQVKLVVKDVDTNTDYLILNQGGINFTVWRYGVYYFPSSPRVISLMFGGSAVPWSTMSRYRMIILNTSNVAVFYSPIFYLADNCDKEVRIRFVNSLGLFDSITFKEKNDILKTISSTWQSRMQRKPTSGAKSIRGSHRFDVRSDNYSQCTGYFEESQMELIKELVASPIAFLEWTGIQGQENEYLPIVIHDTEILANKPEEDYEYAVELSFSLPEKIHLRN